MDNTNKRAPAGIEPTEERPVRKRRPEGVKRSSGKKRKKKRSFGAAVAIRSVKVIGTFLLSLFLIIIITGSIFVTVLTIYVLNFANVDETISLDREVIYSNITKFMYENPNYDPDDPDSEEYLLYYALKNPNRKSQWIDLSEIPLHVQDAYMAAEDERFMQHDGVDFLRTFSAIANTLLGRTQGGSTITQQTIKQITGEDEQRGVAGIERKIKEIFRAINTEKVYTKEDILQCYLNIVPLGDGQQDIIGIQAAANYYFGKDVTQLDIAEAAALAATTKSPATLNPYTAAEENGYRKEWVLGKMLELGSITDAEYQYAMKEELKVTADPDFQSRIDVDEDELNNQGLTDWFMDEAIDEAATRIAEKKGISFKDARQELYNGGYKIYTSVDMNMQKKVEKEMQDASNFQLYNLAEDDLLSCFICIDYQGNVKAVVGKRTEKTEWDEFNIATDGTRSPGSCIKPIASFAPAVDQDLITYSTLINDKPIEIIDENGEKQKWPVNYSEVDESGHWSGQDLFTWQMLARSLNTAPAQLVEKMTPAYCYNFLKEKLDISTLSESDINYAPVTVGGLTNGLHLEELVGAYMIFGNGGKKYEVTYVTSIVDANDEVIYEKSDGYKQAISESSAYVMNQMMQKVITESNGTGRYAKLTKTALAGKTGTSSDWKDLSFVGVTPDYVSGVWIGYEFLEEIPRDKYQNIGAIWKNIFGDVAETETHHNFEMPDTVVEAKYCTRTGLLAGNSCTSTGIGYYKQTNLPATCSGYH
ncbi:MAG: transglycosylase domain-containing protein [Ruminococcus sp.]|nr:transglycosylase domain-containing protein [Ruminococcus sp.]